MKKIIIPSLFLGLLITACQDQNGQADQEKEMKSTEMTLIDDNAKSEKESKTDYEEDVYAFDYLYKSDNGEILNVTYFEENDEMFVKIYRDEHPEIVLPQTTAWSKGAEYENEKIKWKSQENEATYSDGTVDMKLTVISPLQYRYTNDEEEIDVIYLDKDDQRFVTIKRDNEPEVTLEQTSAWAKGAEYGKDEIKWHSQGVNGTLDNNGVKTVFKRRK